MFRHWNGSEWVTFKERQPGMPLEGERPDGGKSSKLGQVPAATDKAGEAEGWKPAPEGPIKPTKDDLTDKTAGHRESVD